MPHNNFEAIEAALQHLKDVVSKNHPTETAFLVSQMETLVAELKIKTVLNTESLQGDGPFHQASPAGATVTGA